MEVNIRTVSGPSSNKRDLVIWVAILSGLQPGDDIVY